MEHWTETTPRFSLIGDHQNSALGDYQNSAPMKNRFQGQFTIHHAHMVTHTSYQLLWRDVTLLMISQPGDRNHAIKEVSLPEMVAILVGNKFVLLVNEVSEQGLQN
jgi:hypothetical protein